MHLLDLFMLYSASLTAVVPNETHAFSAGRKRSRRTMQPKDTKELELDVTDAMYSSSQQINGQQKPGTYHVAVDL